MAAASTTSTPATFQLMRQRIQASNKTGTFQFNETITAFIFGIEQFKLASASTQTLAQYSVVLSLGEGTGVGTPLVTVNVSFGSGLNTGNSWCDVIVLACFAGTGSNISLNQLGSPTVGSTGHSYTLSTPPAVNAGILQGFDLSFSAAKNDFLGLGASAGVVCAPTGSKYAFAPMGTGALFGDAPMDTAGTITVGGIVLSPAAMTQGIQVVAWGNDAGGNISDGFIYSAANVLSAGFILQSFYGGISPMSGSDNFFSSIQCGLTSNSENTGTTITISSGGITGTVEMNLACLYAQEETNGADGEEVTYYPCMTIAGSVAGLLVLLTGPAPAS